MNKRAASLLRRFSKYTKESERQLKKAWNSVPKKQRRKELERLERLVPQLEEAMPYYQESK